MQVHVELFPFGGVEMDRWTGLTRNYCAFGTREIWGS